MKEISNILGVRYFSHQFFWWLEIILGTSYSKTKKMVSLDPTATTRMSWSLWLGWLGSKNVFKNSIEIIAYHKVFLPIHCFYNTLCNNWKLAVLIWCGKSEIAAKIKIMMTKKWIFNAVNGLKLGLEKVHLLKISSFTRNY